MTEKKTSDHEEKEKKAAVKKTAAKPKAEKKAAAPAKKKEEAPAKPAEAPKEAAKAEHAEPHKEKEAPKHVEHVAPKEAAKPAIAEPAAKPAAEKKAKRKPKKEAAKHAHTHAKRKEAIARASVGPGNGRFTVNRVHINALQNRFVRNLITEPLGFIAESGKIDISVNVHGGGMLGQAQAARTAVAKALVVYFNDEKLKGALLEFDRSILVDDVRRVEPKKYKGPKARARFQKSYR
jgi:small subunit ribosomal protein S9